MKFIRIHLGGVNDESTFVSKVLLFMTRHFGNQAFGFPRNRKDAEEGRGRMDGLMRHEFGKDVWLTPSPD